MAIVIIAKRDGFRRCGIAHPGKPTSYPDDFFSDEQLEALRKEPQLVLTCVEDEFDQVLERFNESLSQAASPQMPDALETVQPQTLEADAATVGDAVVSTVSQILGNGQPGPDAQGSGPVSVTGLVEGAPLYDNKDGSPAMDAVEPTASADKTRPTKARGTAK